MGNNSSRSEIITKSLSHAEHQWRNSTPRQVPHLQHKVLPEKNVDTRLRPTDNGEILHNGGTLSKKANIVLASGKKDFEICRSNSVSSHSSEKYNKVEKHRSFLSYHEDLGPRKVSHMQMRQNSEKVSKQNSHVCTAMDIRDKYKNRKKYRAPSPPVNVTLDKKKLDENNSDLETKPGVRKSRLFKTQAELKTKKSSPIEEKNVCENKYAKTNKAPLPNLQRARSMPELQIEIQEIKERIRQMKKYDPEKQAQPISTAIKSSNDEKTSQNHHKYEISLDRHDPQRGSTQNKRNSSKTSQLQKSSNNNNNNNNNETHIKQTPKRTFYFGMNESNDNTTGATSIRNRKHSLSDSSRSDSSSCEIIASTKDESKDGIALHLRPILPKKQLEIPRFSPSTAWKMLSTVENQSAKTISGEENSFLIEEKIKKRPRYPPPPPPIVQIGSRSNNDKSGDSGISGDAGPPAYDDSPEVDDSRNELMLPIMLSESQLTSWTPQQDLQEDSSEEETNSKILFQPISSATDIQSRRNVFSLSLPRDNRFAAYIDNKDIHVNSSLQRFKNSVVGVLSTFNNNKKELNENNSFKTQNSNWFLSKSVPNSLNNNGFRSLDFQNSKKDEESKFVNSQQNIGRLMYLPEQKNHFRHSSREDKKNLVDYRRKSSNLSELKVNSYLSNSTDNISQKINNISTDDNKLNKSKRFTFQSTIRQIERRRLAEKLSKEAEIKEKQRLSEFEAMQRVEREFQQKRAREKANIKQKLRLFSFEEANYFSLPYETNFTNDLSVRPEPDGALSSARSSPNANKTFSEKKYYDVLADTKEDLMNSENRTGLHESEDNVIKAQATEILSEYRQMTREYKDFRSSHYFNDFNENNIIKPTTVYPQVTYNMPKAYGYQHS